MRILPALWHCIFILIKFVVFIVVVCIFCICTVVSYTLFGQKWSWIKEYFWEGHWTPTDLVRWSFMDDSINVHIKTQPVFGKDNTPVVIGFYYKSPYHTFINRRTVILTTRRKYIMEDYML
jgi:hypothetical protein